MSWGCPARTAVIVNVPVWDIPNMRNRLLATESPAEGSSGVPHATSWLSAADGSAAWVRALRRPQRVAPHTCHVRMTTVPVPAVLRENVDVEAAHGRVRHRRPSVPTMAA